MSGIAGIYGIDDKQLLISMLSKLHHRGPYIQDIYSSKNIQLGCRLLFEEEKNNKGVHVSNEIKKKYIVFDGIISNHEEVKKYLLKHPSDKIANSEAILLLYNELGSECISKLNGAFALAILDNRKLFLARDPSGIKPLYYGYKNGSLYFASEIKALIGVVDKIKEFPPGHFYLTDTGFKEYFSLAKEIPQEYNSYPLESIIEQLESKLEEAVKGQIPFNLLFGVLLSGGIDSSIIAFLAKKSCNDFHTFSAGMKESTDLKYASEMAKFIGSNHHEYIYNLEEVLEILPKVIYHLESFDALLVRSSIANYFLSRLASIYVKVVLCGEGSDELFAGYHYLKEIKNPLELDNKLREITLSLHNTGLQRVDRMNLANSIEGRIPFLDLDFVKYAFTIHPNYKIHDGVEKWIIRETFKKYLPSSIIERKKERFWSGTGIKNVIEEFAEGEISDSEFERERKIGGKFIINSKEELYYYRIFSTFFPLDSIWEEMGRSRGI